MTTFVEECRQEWRRLGVPDILADEMAGDLEADLAEAQSEGVPASEILGESDPRRFAATWALERGLVAEGSRKRRFRLARLVFVAGVLVLAAAGTALALTLMRTSDKPAGVVMHGRFFQWPKRNIADISCGVFHLHLHPQDPGDSFVGHGQRLFCELNTDSAGRLWVWALGETGKTRRGPTRTFWAPVIPPGRQRSEVLTKQGREWSLGAFTCESRSTGLTCRNTSQHGFTMSGTSSRFSSQRGFIGGRISVVTF